MDSGKENENFRIAPARIRKSRQVAESLAFGGYSGLYRECARIKCSVVNLHPVRASTWVMAAGTPLEAMTMTMARAEDSATVEFSRVVERHRPQIFRFLLSSTRDVDLAETLTQECFLKAHRNWSSFRGESSAMTWLMRIAINLQKDHWRNRRMQFWRTTRTNSVDLDEASEWLPSGESSVEQQLLARERVKQVWASVKGLSERQRTVFLLRYVEEQELREIAEATGLSEGTVKAHLSRAVARVRLELGGKR
jgi:RNA polymerase sigma-70 factor, ECF subfamily